MRKLRNMKPAVNSLSQPAIFRHLKTKPKRVQLLEERCTEIERENRILLEKMTGILQSQKSNLAPGVGVIRASNLNQSVFNVQSAGARKSLNRDARKRELLKITLEN